MPRLAKRHSGHQARRENNDQSGQRPSDHVFETQIRNEGRDENVLRGNSFGADVLTPNTNTEASVPTRGITPNASSTIPKLIKPLCTGE